MPKKTYKHITTYHMTHVANGFDLGVILLVHLLFVHYLPQAHSLNTKAHSTTGCQQLPKQQQWVQPPALISK